MRLDEWEEKFNALVKEMEEDDVFFYCTDNADGDCYPVLNRGGLTLHARARNYPRRT